MLTFITVIFLSLYLLSLGYFIVFSCLRLPNRVPTPELSCKLQPCGCKCLLKFDSEMPHRHLQQSLFKAEFSPGPHTSTLSLLFSLLVKGPIIQLVAEVGHKELLCIFLSFVALTSPSQIYPIPRPVNSHSKTSLLIQIHEDHSH